MNKTETIIIRVNEDAETSAMTFDEWLERGRQWWKTRADRALNADRLIVVDYDNTITAVGDVSGVQKDIETGSGRVSIIVVPDPDSELIGKTVDRGSSRNPVAYVQDVFVSEKADMD